MTDTEAAAAATAENEGALTELERELTLIAWGILIGFGYLTGWKAYRQTSTISREKRYRSSYFWWVWMDYVSIMVFGVLAWILNQKHIRPQLSLYIPLVALWAIQAQALLQININRIELIAVDKAFNNRVRIGCLAIVSVFIVGTFSVWIPGRLGTSAKITQISKVYIEVQGTLTILLDIALNTYFIRTVKATLIDPGLDKYKPIVSHNLMLVYTAITVEVVALGLMWLPASPFVWLQYGTLAWMGKLNVELSMADLIMKLAYHTPEPSSLELRPISRAGSEQISNMSFQDLVPPTRNQPNTNGS
ncbi:hypothetical protein P167DRAFT_138934 [Morchella conica CCBAS932]|uniref:Uncharacterized protein n=1 Tax=Morchella conica CCBAS932 TaxID=1392247 RepID=A0A3N4KR08_9PEZI|nr:hypothetical protein P167DRAFT_138934 [Morchella conica CCBAS932]